MSENDEMKEKIPPMFVIDKESIYGIVDEDKDKKEKIQAIPEAIKGKGLSGVFYNTLMRGNAITELNNVDRYIFYCTAMELVGIECDDLFDEISKLNVEMRQYDQALKLLDKIIENRSSKYPPDFSGIRKIDQDLTEKFNALNIRILKRLFKGLSSISGVDSQEFQKLLMSGGV